MGEKTVVRVCVTLSILASLYGAVRAEAKITLPREEAYKSISEERLARSISFLTDSICGGRATGTAGNAEAAFWIMRQFRKADLKPMLCDGESYFSSFPAGDSLVGHSVIGMMAGGKQGNNSYVIVAAHFDGLGVLGGKLYPGADSNASGVAALVGMAEMFKAMRKFRTYYSKNVIFVALDATRLNLAGAKNLWSLVEQGKLVDPETGLAVTKDKVKLMVNIDQIGSTLSPLERGKSEYLIMLSRNIGEFRMNNLSILNERYGTHLHLGYDYYGSGDFTKIFLETVSDQRPFLENGVPVVMFTSGITMNNNKTYDNLKNLSLGTLKRRIMLIFHWLERA